MIFTPELYRLDPLNKLEAIERYEFYRKRGLDPEEAFKAALAWQRNRDEQAERRRSHDTGEVKHERTTDSRWVRPGVGLRVRREI